MASSGVPPQVRHQVFGGGGHLKVVHPQSVRLPAMHMVHLGGGAGEGAKNEGAGKGIRAGFGEGAQPRAERGESGDAVVTGNYERMPYTTLYGFPIAGGGLTDKGKEDKQAHDQFTQFVSQYGDGRQQGLSKEQALTQAARGLPGGVKGLYSVLAAHPDAMRMLDSADALHDRLSGAAQQQQQPQYTQVKGADGKYYNVQIDPNTGKAGNPEDIGLPGTPPKPEKPVKPDKPQLVHTSGGIGTVSYGPDNKPVFTPLTDPKTGATLGDVPKGKPPTSNGFTQSDIGAGQQAPEIRPDGKMPSFNPVDGRFLRAIPSAIDSLNTIQKYAPGVAGLGRDLVSIAAGNYLGTDPQAQKVSQAFKQINALSSDMAQRGAKVPTANWAALAGTPAMAPSAINAYAMSFKKVLRDTGQDTADQMTAHAGQRLPLIQAQALMKAGIFPNGYQTSQYTRDDPAFSDQGAWWTARHFPQGLNDAQRGQILDQALSMGTSDAARKQALGDDDYGIVRGIAQNRVSQATATTAQGASTATANNANNPPPQEQPPPQSQPSPGTGTQPPAGEQPSGAPQGTPGLQSAATPAPTDQGSTAAPQGTAQPLPAASTAPGNLVPGIPTMQGMVPEAPPLPPPLAQTTLPSGAPPAPSVQPSVGAQTQSAAQTQQTQAVAGQAAAQAVASPSGSGQSAPISPPQKNIYDDAAAKADAQGQQ